MSLLNKFKIPVLLRPIKINNILSIIGILSLFIVLIDSIAIISASWLRLEQYWRFLIIPIFCYMLYAKNDVIFHQLSHHSYVPGHIILFFGTFLYILATLSLIEFLLEISIILFIIALFLYIFGSRALFAAILPFCYLILATSVAERILDNIGIYMQHISAFLSALCLNFFGWTVLRDGLYIKLPTTILKVADVCSGVNQLTALLAFSTPLAYIKHKKAYKRVILIFSSFPLAIIFNSIRIALIGLWNYNTVRENIHGPGDILLIPVIYPLALGTLFLISRLLKQEEQNGKHKISIQNQINQISIPAATGLIVITMSGLLVRVGYMRSSESIYPPEIKIQNTYITKDSPSAKTNFSSLLFNTSPPHEDSLQRYYSKDGDTIVIYSGIFKKQTFQKQPLKFNDNTLNQTTEKISLQINGVYLTVPIVKTKKDNSILTGFFLFTTENGIFSSSRELKIKSFKNAILSRQNGAACNFIFYKQTPQDKYDVSTTTRKLETFLTKNRLHIQSEKRKEY